MRLDLANACKVQQVWNKLIGGVGPFTTSSVDMGQAEYCMLTLCASDSTFAAVTATLTLQDSADDSSFATVSGVTALTLTAVSQVRMWVIHKAAVRRYIRVHLAQSGVGSCFIDIQALSYGGGAFNGTPTTPNQVVA